MYVDAAPRKLYRAPATPVGALLFLPLATSQKTKGHPKDIQGLMRHSRLATTMKIYMQSLEKEVRTAINSIHDELVATGTEGHQLRSRCSILQEPGS